MEWIPTTGYQPVTVAPGVLIDPQAHAGLIVQPRPNLAPYNAVPLDAAQYSIAQPMSNRAGNPTVAAPQGIAASGIGPSPAPGALRQLLTSWWQQLDNWRAVPKTIFQG